jgi:polyphenol oxidase
MISAFKHPALQGVKHGFFSREGGVSTGNFSSLNMSYEKKEFAEQDCAEHVSENRFRALKFLGLSHYPLIVANQKHTSKVAIICETDGTTPVCPADALVTNQPGIAIGVLTADCAPILIYEPKKKLIAAIHAGWRGAFGMIIENALDAMLSLGGKYEEMIAVLGPVIHQKDYQVDGAFFQNFQTRYPGVDSFFQKDKDAWRFDLRGFVLSKLGRFIEKTYDLGMNTFNQEFFSCRRAFLENKKSFGVHLSVIGLS